MVRDALQTLAVLLLALGDSLAENKAYDFTNLASVQQLPGWSQIPRFKLSPGSGLGQGRGQIEKQQHTAGNSLYKF